MPPRDKAVNVAGKATGVGMMRIETMTHMKEVCRGKSSEAGRQEAVRVAVLEAARGAVEQGVEVVGEVVVAVGEEGVAGEVRAEVDVERQEVDDSGISSKKSL